MRGTQRLLKMLTVAFLLFILMPQASAQQEDGANFTVKPGYTFEELKYNAGGGFDYLPNGDGIVITYSLGGNPAIWIVDANGDGTPPTPRQVGTIPAGTFGSFVKVSPDGTFALIGATGSTHPLIRMNLTNYAMTTLTQVPGQHSLVFLDHQRVLISANESLNRQLPNKILLIDLGSPNVKITIAEIFNTPSGPIAKNDAGDIYYVKSTWQFPPPPNGHRVLKFRSNHVEEVIDNLRPTLKESDSLVNITINGGYNIALNAFNDLFVASLDGEIIKVNERTGSTEKFCATPNVPNDGSFFHLAFFKTNHFLNPYEKSVSKLGAVFADITFTKFSVVQLKSDADDPFADKVLSFKPGQGGSSDAMKISGTPVGGGTAVPNNSSIVVLGDRDNPTAASPATVEVQLNNPARDDAENLHGMDVIVFGNSFWVAGNPQNRFAEPALVEVSQDLNHNGKADDEWFLIAPNILPANLGPTNPVQYNTMTLRNYADYSPTLLLGDTNGDNIVDVPNMKPENFYTVPDRPSYLGDPQSYLVDNNSGGGDAADLREGVVQISPGVPFVDATGRRRAVFLDRVHFVRLRDVRKDDVYSGLGTVVADIDAVADAKPRLRGKTFSVSTVVELTSALSSAIKGDEIILAPGTYWLSTTLAVPSGVSLKGSAGLWTVNDTSDDAVLNCRNLSPNAAAVSLSDPNGTFSFEQGYEISGLHFDNCSVGVSVNRLSPTIQNNFFKDVGKALVVNNASSQTTVIRNNLFGHRACRFPSVGVEAQDSRLALTHNTFVRHTSAAVLLNTNSEAYMRDNIFFQNTVGISGQSSRYVYGHYNVFYGNPQKYNFPTGLMEKEILAEPQFAFLAHGDFRLQMTSPVRQQAMGGADPGVYDGAAFDPFDIVPYSISACEIPPVFALTK